MLVMEKCCMCCVMDQSESYSALLGFFTDMAAARVDLNPTAHMFKKGTDAGTPSPNVDSVTSRPDDEWLLQSFLVSEVECARDTAGSFLTSSLPACPCLLSQCSRSVDAAKGTSNALRSLEECERRRARRERNRIAAARCRDRRRMLTDTLQNESEHLEQVKAQLEQEIAGLEREKERLEFILEAHKPACKMDNSNPELS